MIVLEEFKMLQQSMGLDAQSGSKKIILRFLYWTLLSTSAFLTSTFFVVNIRTNTHQAMATLPTVIGFWLLTANYLHMLGSREQMYSLFDELQNIVNESTKRKLINFLSRLH